MLQRYLQRAIDVLRTNGMDHWASRLRAMIDEGVAGSHGDLARWTEAIERLPDPKTVTFDGAQRAVQLETRMPLTAEQREGLQKSLEALIPWRKGPFHVFGLQLDAEWRCDKKWARVAPVLDSLDGRRVLDVGSGNGYYCLRAAGQGARLVVGADPMWLAVCQFLAIWRMMPEDSHAKRSVFVVPFRGEQLPDDGQFDTVFSMGVLHHQRHPLDHLRDLRRFVRQDGQLVLETLVVDGAAGDVLRPQGRYAKMRNVWVLPAVDTLCRWMAEAGWTDVNAVDVTRTTPEEQRATAWMPYESLIDFLDPTDSSRTIEGHPAPQRAVIIARSASI